MEEGASWKRGAFFYAAGIAAMACSNGKSALAIG
jgi:hypothetical protein